MHPESIAALQSLCGSISPRGPTADCGLDDPPRLAFCSKNVVVIDRPLAEREWDMVRAFVERAQREDLRQRFGHPLNFGDEATLRRAFAIKAGSAEVTWLVNDSAVIAAIAHRIMITPAEAEIGLIVRSDLKHRGIGEFLLRNVLARAARHGVTTLSASVLRENRPMLRLAAKIGYEARAACGLSVEMTFNIGGAIAPACPRRWKCSARDLGA